MAGFGDMTAILSALLLTGEEVLHGELELSLVLLGLPLKFSSIHQFCYIFLVFRYISH